MAGNIFEYTISMRGEHFVLDSVLALTAALCAAFDDDSLEDIVVRHNEKIRTLFLPLFEFLQVLEGRGRISSLFIRNLQILLVDDSYNANLNSMSAGLRSFLKQKASRHIAVVGDMLELGPYAQEDHETLFKTFANSCLSKVFAVGRACEEPWKSLPQHQKGGWSETAQDLWPLIERELQSGDAVWVKGSHSMNLDWIVQQMKKEAQLDKKTHKAA
jgi:hypothetical protein